MVVVTKTHCDECHLRFGSQEKTKQVGTDVVHTSCVESHRRRMAINRQTDEPSTVKRRIGKMVKHRMN